MLGIVIRMAQWQTSRLIYTPIFLKQPGHLFHLMGMNVANSHHMHHATELRRFKEARGLEAYHQQAQTPHQ